MNINIPKNIEDFLKEKFGVSDLTEIVNNVVSDWAKNEVRLKIGSKSIDDIISDEVILKETKIQAELEPVLGGITLKKSKKYVTIK